MASDILSHYPCLQGLEPADFYRWFAEICRIPHGSYNEQKLIKFLENFAADRNIPFQKDAAGNLLMQIAAAKGYEDQPAVLFQAHMDMVWAKDPDVEFDFATQPIALQVCGDRLTAPGTTLGADNAVGMATMLALADGNYPHPPLELLFTVAEEVGHVGIRQFDMKKLKARRLINMDCGDSHVLCVSSAGKSYGEINHSFSLQSIPAGYGGLQVEISGGLSGHGSLDANKFRCCAANALGDLLTGLQDFRLCCIRGSKAIMPEASAIIAVPEDIRATLTHRFNGIATIYAQTDPGIRLTLSSCQLPEQALDGESSCRAAQVLSLLRTTQYRTDENGSTVTVGVINKVDLTDGEFSLNYSVHSTNAADQQLQYARCAATVALLGMELELKVGYSGWPERKDSPFRDKFQAVHNALFGKDLEIERCPGGIESGDIVSQIPDMDAIGIAPTARGAHTPGEYLLIDEVMPYWKLLTTVLAQKE